MIKDSGYTVSSRFTDESIGADFMDKVVPGHRIRKYLVDNDMVQIEKNHKIQVCVPDIDRLIYIYRNRRRY